MEPTANRKPIWTSVLFVLLGTIAIAVTAVALVPTWRQALRMKLIRPYRTILAKTSGDLTGRQDMVTVLKVKTHEGLALEIYKTPLGGQDEALMDRLQLDEDRDAFVNIRSKITNLALMDLDGDGNLEIMAPTYDENLVPRLHVFTYDAKQDKFIRLGPEAAAL